jgi:hypothetical protein
VKEVFKIGTATGHSMFDLPEEKAHGAKHALYALGHLKEGEMNKTEAAFSVHLEYLRLNGEVLWWRFDCVKLRIAPATFLTVDFAVLMKDGHLCFIDVKGHRAIYQDDARVKMKVAADTYPVKFFVSFPQGKLGASGWDMEEV